MDLTAPFRSGSAFLAARKQKARSRSNHQPVMPGRLVCNSSATNEVNSAEQASNAARQQRFLAEIDKLAEARRLEHSRLRSPMPDATSQPQAQQQQQQNAPNMPQTAAAKLDTQNGVAAPPQPQQQQEQRQALNQPPPAPGGAMQRVHRSAAPQKSNADTDAAQARQADRRFVRVKFVLHLHIDYGQRIKVVGSDLMLGGWNLQHAPELSWSEGDRWHVSADLPSNGIYEYKYVIVGSDGQTPISWQRGNNSVLAIKPDDDRVEVYDNWDGQPGAAVIANGQSATREARLQTWANQMDALAGSQRAELRRTRMELAASQEETRGARADVSRLKATLARTQADMLTAERKIRELERTNQLLRAQLAESSLTFHKAFETAQRLLSKERQWHASAEEDASLTLTPTPPPPSPIPPRRPESPLSPPVDVNDSLEFLSMLGRSQFAFRGRKEDSAEFRDEETDGLTDVDGAVDREDVAARAEAESAQEAVQEAASDSEEDSEESDSDGGYEAHESSATEAHAHIRAARVQDEGVSARGRASVSAVQNFISRIRQGLGVRHTAETETPEPVAASVQEEAELAEEAVEAQAASEWTPEGPLEGPSEEPAENSKIVSEEVQSDEQPEEESDSEDEGAPGAPEGPKDVQEPAAAVAETHDAYDGVLADDDALINRAPGGPPVNGSSNGFAHGVESGAAVNGAANGLVITTSSGESVHLSSNEAASSVHAN